MTSHRRAISAPKKRLKWRVINALARGAERLAIDQVLNRLVRNKTSLTVLTYHRVAEAHDYGHLDPALISASPDGFAMQLDYLKERYNFVDAQLVLAAARGESSLPEHPMLITFDDGYEDFASNAWPELKRRSIPAVLFVSTQNVETQSGYWWDQLHLLLKQMGRQNIRIPSLSSDPLPAAEHATKKRLKVWLKSLRPDLAQEWIDCQSKTVGVAPAECSILDWSALNSLAAQGVTICPHTQTHPIMTRLCSRQVAQEISGSYEDLLSNIGEALPLFAYPSGYVDDRTRELCAQSPMELAFTTKFGSNKLTEVDPLRLRRINVPRESEPVFLGFQAIVARLRG